MLYNAGNIHLVMKEGVVESVDKAYLHHYRVREDQPAKQMQGGGGSGA